LLYKDFISENLLEHLKKEAKPVHGLPYLTEVGTGGGLETTESLQFLCELFEMVKMPLEKVLSQRTIDREFIDARTRACVKLNQDLKIDFSEKDYETVLGHRTKK